MGGEVEDSQRIRCRQVLDPCYHWHPSQRNRLCQCQPRHQLWFPQLHAYLHSQGRKNRQSRTNRNSHHFVYWWGQAAGQIACKFAQNFRLQIAWLDRRNAQSQKAAHKEAGEVPSAKTASGSSRRKGQKLVEGDRGARKTMAKAQEEIAVEGREREESRWWLGTGWIIRRMIVKLPLILSQHSWSIL